MLNHFGRVFLIPTTTYVTEGRPGLWAKAIDVKNEKTIGIIRYNVDKNYSDSLKALRASFDVVDLNMIDPKTAEAERILEDLVTATMTWPIRDNNHLFYDSGKADAKDVRVYMTVKVYPQDPVVMQNINVKVITTLMNLGAERSEVHNEKYIIWPTKINDRYFSRIISR